MMTQSVMENIYIYPISIKDSNTIHDTKTQQVEYYITINGQNEQEAIDRSSDPNFEVAIVVEILIEKFRLITKTCLYRDRIYGLSYTMNPKVLKLSRYIRESKGEESPIDITERAIRHWAGHKA